MKKLLAIMVLGLAMLMGFSSPIRAEVYPYTFQFFDNYQYDLTTGQYRANPYWVSTNRVIVPTTDFTLNSLDYASYVLFFTETNYFIGYYTINGQGTIITSKYLSTDVQSLTFTFPQGTFKIAFTSMKVTTGQETNLPDEPSYADVFENPTFLNYTDETLLPESTLGDIFGNPSYMDYTFSLLDSTLATIYSDYALFYLDYVDGLGIPILTLTNLIQNGDYSNGTTGVTAYGGTGSVSNGIYTLTGDGSTNTPFLYFLYATTATNYYYIGSRSRVLANANNINHYYAASSAINALLSTPTANTWYLISDLDIDASSRNVLRVQQSYSSNALANGKVLESDFVVVFSVGASPAYTKSQIDSAIAQFGYFPYNQTILVPDVSNALWDDNALDFTLNTLSDWNGTINHVASAITLDWLDICNVVIGDCTDVLTFFSSPSPMGNYSTDMEYLWNLIIDAQDEVERWEWYEYGGVTESNYPYYADLYQDALNEVSRWEFYRNYGVTAQNYATLLAQYQDLLQETAIDFETFSLLDGLGDREESTYERRTVAEFIEDALSEWNIGDYVFIIISILSMLIMVIVLGMKKSPFSIIYIMAGILFLLFAVFGWFPTWLVLLVVILLFILSLKIVVN